MGIENAPDFERGLPTRDEVITLLRNKGIDDPETTQALLDYDMVGRTLSDVAEDTEQNNTERFQRVIEMAKIYYEGGYMEYARQSLEELSFASQSDEMMDMIHDALDGMV
jgi:hypothetical protein